MIKLDDNKIYSTLRSLFRYSKLKELQAPEILFENEKKMIMKRISALTPEEIFVCFTSWEKFYIQQCIEDELQNKEFDKDLDQYQQSLN